MSSIVHRLSSALAMILVPALLAACGSAAAPSSSSSDTTAAGAPLVKPTPGHAIFHPTPAQSYIYLPTTAVREPNGDILIADAGNWNRVGAKLVEMNPQGKPIWVYTGGMDFTHSAYPVGHGQILVTDTNNNRVFIVNHQGKIVWNTDDLGGGKGYLGRGRFSDGGQLLYPNDAVMLPNGHILISSRMNSTVWEIDKKGHVYWKCNRFMYHQHRPRLLPNGNLMVADSDNARVIIINHACTKILWQYDGTLPNGQPTLLWPRSFNQLPDGNYLIGDSLHNRLIEVTPQKQIVRQWTDLPQPYYAEVEANGNIMLGDSPAHGAVELTPSGQIAHVYATRPPRALPPSLINPGFEVSQPHAWLKGDLLTETLPPGVRANMAYDTHVKHSGQSSARITWNHHSAHLFLFWFQPVAVQAGRTYTFSGWIKTKGVTACAECDFGKGTVPGNDAAYVIAFIKPGPYAALPAVTLPPLKGTTGWVHETKTFKVPDGVIGVVVECVLYGKGTVWFDDVSLK
jgi:hypothetical protein